MPLTYRDKGTSGTQLQIVSNERPVGVLRKMVLSQMTGQQARWAWTWHEGPGAGPQQHGTAASVDEAKAQIEDQWRVWLAATGLRDG